jgi:toxin ParE1/3/4
VDGGAVTLLLERDFFRYRREFVYWKRLDDGNLGNVTVLHERMHQIERFKDDFS